MKTTIHLQMLDRLRYVLQASQMARENGARLAPRYDDLVIVLQEPSDKTYKDEYEAVKASSKAIQLVEKSLALAIQRRVDPEWEAFPQC
jgi:ribosomal protein L15